LLLFRALEGRLLPLDGPLRDRNGLLDWVRMDNTTIQFENLLVNYVRGLAVVDPAQPIPLDQSLLEAGLLDSFGIVEMLTYLESEFDVTIPDEDMTKENLGSIRKMADYVYRRKSA
jgi:acyl carrier protein